jgi:hypothetical protein
VGGRPQFRGRACRRSQNSPAGAPASYKFGGAGGDALNLEFGQPAETSYGGYGGAARIRYTCLLVHLVGGNLAGGVEKGGGTAWSLLPWKWWICSVYVCYRFAVRRFGSI